MTANNSMMMSNILTNVSSLEGKKEKDIFIMWFCLSMQSNCEKLIWFKLITDLELLREHLKKKFQKVEKSPHFLDPPSLPRGEYPNQEELLIKQERI